MHWNKPPRFTFFTEDFYCPVISEAEGIREDSPFHASPPSLANSESEQKYESEDRISESSQNAVSLASDIVDENCNVIQELFQQDDNYSTQEQDEIDLKVDNAIALDVTLHSVDKGNDVFTNTSQSHLIDKASGISQPVMMECAAGTSQPFMVECGIQTSQDFGLKNETEKQRSTCKLPIVLPRLALQRSGPEVPVKIHRIDENEPTIYSVTSETYDFEDSNKENSSTVVYHRGYKNKGNVKRHFPAWKDQLKTKPLEELTNENEGPSNESTLSSRGTFLRVGLSKRRALKPLHAKVPFGLQSHFNIPKPLRTEESEDDDEYE